MKIVGYFSARSEIRSKSRTTQNYFALYNDPNFVDPTIVKEFKTKSNTIVLMYFTRTN